MYTLKISIVNQDASTKKEFEKAANTFLNRLSSVSGLEIKPQTQDVEGTRGAITLLSGIILAGINLGVFSALYTLYKDFCELYANAEVQLHFEDGSTITLKGLTRKEAEQILQEHLKKTETNS